MTIATVVVAVAKLTGVEAPTFRLVIVQDGANVNASNDQGLPA